jgi:hypothetical protein
MTPTFIRFEGYAWLLWLRYGRLLVLAGCYATRTEALAVASTIDGLPG